MTTVPTDASLAAAFAAGDRDAGDALFVRHAAELRAFLAARCRDAELAGELLQEVAWRMVAAAHRLDPRRNVRAYLFRSAANVWRDHVRREIVRRRAANRLGDGAATAPPAADARLLERDLRAAVHRAIAALPTAQRDVVELRHRTGLTFREIADRLGRPLGTVLTQMRAALATIGAALESHR
jgi:RNA polymerase sigma-70 factor, ECF subfamily